MSGRAPPAPGIRPRVTLIVAMARNRVIGKEGRLSWRLPDDLKRFRALTMGHPIIMGRKTYDSIGRPLPGRRNIVISRNPGLTIEGVNLVTSLSAALDLAKDSDEVFIVGGEQIYKEALAFADRIELTEVDDDVDGDVWFPEIDVGQWRESRREPRHDRASGLHYTFVTLDRVRG